jgi:hypothetical protein
MFLQLADRAGAITLIFLLRSWGRVSYSRLNMELSKGYNPEYESLIEE